MEIILVMTMLPNAEAANGLAEHLVKSRLAACVSILAPCRSVYRWQEHIENAEEVPLLIKSTADRYSALEAAIHERHPYELPEILAVPADRGLPAYLAWVAAETATPPCP
jgi:periplasmic divalent cation tolerance protein